MTASPWDPPPAILAIEDRLRTHPDDGESWLVYADWLTEIGDSRGELIVLERQLAAGVTTLATAGARIAELKAPHRDRARSEMEEIFSRGAKTRWQHGFVRTCGLHVYGSWLERFEDSCRRPWGRLINDATFDELRHRNGAHALAASPMLRHLTALRLTTSVSPSFDIDDYDLRALLRSENLGVLTTLEIDTFDGIGVQGAKVLAAARSLRHLERLLLHKENVGDVGAAALARSRFLRNLVELDLSDNRIGAVGAQALARAEWPRLARLALWENRLTGEDWELLRSAGLTRDTDEDEDTDEDTDEDE